MKLSEIANKDVIREEDGVKLGRICDVSLDITSGKILNLFVSNGFKILSIFSKDVVQIPWHKIIKIGNDVIIVETNHTIKNKE